jgi:hypothetical protein
VTSLSQRALRWLGRFRDGSSALLERQAVGLADAAVPAGPPASPAGVGRPAPAAPHQLIREQIAGKVLHGWLQNRHQTLFPLAVNLRNLPPEHRLLVARCMAASAAMTGAPPPRAAVLALGGGAAEQAALGETGDLPGLLAALRAGHLGPYAFSASAAALQGGRAAAAWLDFLAAALDLPAEIAADLRRRGGARLRPRSR